MRTPNLGIHMALGATGNDVLVLIASGGLRLTSVGIVAGALGSVASSRRIQSMLYSTSTMDGATLSIVCALILATALVAVLLPAYRATRLGITKALSVQ